ncbi:hypothetical protein FisN_21Lh229 [Fistulifera solaris]|uniref:Uncharacterized protein n=1 Tax=Fistulifera solaris TaxID=1519565 RepID=A0A1Z5J9F3_FISSO|nr:hypothetical protein FisN_21Lh229 [Fistulifera solaris]|eukprot:GAX10522.1 hypothetical protein FisN_21Lh229 [Fistulifera solaris]
MDNNNKKKKDTDTSAVEAGRAIDRSFFESLTDAQLAQHVFPLSLDNKSRLAIVYHFIDEFYRRFGLRVSHNPTEKKWYPGSAPGDDTAKKPFVHIFREDNHWHCDLYCSDCRDCRDTCAGKLGKDYTKFLGEVTVVATITFKTLPSSKKKDTLYRGFVSHLYYHHVHNDGGDLKQLMSSGWCILSTPHDLAGVYDKGMAHCKEYLHPDKGNKVQQHENLVPINLGSGEKSMDNRYHLMMSKKGKSWDERLVNACCNDEPDGASLVELTKHRQVIVSLFYAICCRLGLDNIASPFIYPMRGFLIQNSEKNRRVNPQCRLFCNEESLLAGGFAHSPSVPAQPVHCDHPDCEQFLGTVVTEYPPTETDLGQLLDAGMTFIHPLSEQGRLVHVLKSPLHIQPHQTLVFLGNVAHAGATHHLKKDDSRKPTWPALHVHIDVKNNERGSPLLIDKDDTHLIFKKVNPSEPKYTPSKRKKI